MAASIKIASLAEAANSPELKKLPDGRLRLTRFMNAGSIGQVTESMFDPFGTPDKLAKDMMLVDVQLNVERVQNSAGMLTHLLILIAVFETLPAVTTGSITSGQHTLTVATGLGASFQIGNAITVAGAGAAGATLTTTITGIAGDVLTLTAAAGTTVSGAVSSQSPSEVQVGKNTRVTDDNGREVIRAQFLQLSGAVETPGTIGTTMAPSPDSSIAVLYGEKVENDGALRRIERTYVQAAGSESQVGGDDFTVDENGRRSVQRRFVQLSSAGFLPALPSSDTSTIITATTTGSVNVSINAFTLSLASGAGASFRIGDIIKVVGAGTAGGLLTTTVAAVLGGDVLTLTDAASTTVSSAVVTGSNTFFLAGVKKTESLAIRTIVRTYIEATTTLTEIGNPEANDVPGVFKNFLTTGSITSGTAALTVADATGLAVSNNITVAGAGATTGSITNGSHHLNVPTDVGATFVVGSTITVAGAGIAGATLTTTVSSISIDEITLAATASTTVSGAVVKGNTLSSTVSAITGTAVTLSGNAGNTVSGSVVTGVCSLPARDWTHRLIVLGNGQSAALRLPFNTPYFSGFFSGFQRYLIAQKISPQGIGGCLITRVYRELGDPYSYKKDILYAFPGKMGGTYASPDFIVPSTHWTQATITERYALEAPLVSSIDFNVIGWLLMLEVFTPDATGLQQTYPSTWPNWLGGGYGQSPTIPTYVREGVPGTNYGFNTGSTPLYPTAATGLTRTVKSELEGEWAGKMVRIVDTKITFPP